MLLRLFIMLVSLWLPLVFLGCVTPADAPTNPAASATNMWVASDDGLLALRFSVLTPGSKASEEIHVTAAIQNVSRQKLTVLRPFGDHYSARAGGIKIWDGERLIRYTGPALTYVIGEKSFALLNPGEVVEDRMELMIGSYKGISSTGRYTLRYDYSYDGYWDATAAAGNSGISNAWRGTISSREVGGFRK